MTKKRKRGEKIQGGGKSQSQVGPQRKGNEKKIVPIQGVDLRWFEDMVHLTEKGKTKERGKKKKEIRGGLMGEKGVQEIRETALS